MRTDLAGNGDVAPGPTIRAAMVANDRLLQAIVEAVAQKGVAYSPYDRNGGVKGGSKRATPLSMSLDQRL